MPFKAKAACRRHIPKQQHRVTNWAEYDAGLRARGSLTVWFTAEGTVNLGGAWRHLVAWIRQESSKIRHLWRLTDSEIASPFSGLAYPCNKVPQSGRHRAAPFRRLRSRIVLIP